MYYSINEPHRNILQSYFKQLLVVRLDEYNIPKSLIEQREEFFRNEFALEASRLGELDRHFATLLAITSAIAQNFGKKYFDVKSNHSSSITTTSESAQGVDDEIGGDILEYKRLTFEEFKTIQKTEKAISKFMYEFEGFGDSSITIDANGNEFRPSFAHVPNLSITIKIDKLTIPLPKSLNEFLIADLIQHFGTLYSDSINSFASDKSKRRSPQQSFFKNVIGKLFPFIDHVGYGENSQLTISGKHRFIAGLVFVSMGLIMERSVYYNPNRERYKKGRGDSEADYYSFLTKQIRNYSER